MNAVVSEKGQLTIPKAIRDRLGIRPGQVVVVEEEKGRIVIRKESTPDALDALYGSVDLGMSTDAYMDQIRGSDPVLRKLRGRRRK